MRRTAGSLLLAAILLPASASAGVSTFGELLFLRPSDGRSQYAQVDENGAAAGGQGRVLAIEHSYVPGVRAGMGYAFESFPGELRLVYTYLLTRKATALPAPTGGQLFARLLPELSAASVQAVNEFAYRTADMELGRALGNPEGFHARLFLGLRYARIRKSLRAAYSGGDFPSAGTLAEDRMRFDGIGPRAGFDGSLELPFGALAAAHVSLAAVSGKYQRVFASESLSPQERPEDLNIVALNPSFSISLAEVS